MAETNSPAFLRLFIALAVPPEIQAAIGRAQGRLKRHCPPGAVRWACPEQFHVTLKFLGDVPPEQVTDVTRSAATVCSAFPALGLSVQGIGFFPSPAKARVIWVGAQDRDGHLPELARRLDASLRWLAPAQPPEKFTGHITLGRLKPGHHAAIPKLMDAAVQIQDRHFGDWQTKEIELVRSELTSAGATHIPVAIFRLAE